MVLTIQGLLSVQEVKRARAVLSTATFIDGNATVSSLKSLKNNRELEVGEAYIALVEVIDKALRNSDELARKLFPRFMTRPIINRYEAGMFYKEHIDSPIQGLKTQFGRSMAPFGQGFVRADFSMTLFLDDPSSYDGGELEITIDGEKQCYKLEAGSAVFYQTGTPHSVRTIVHGVRSAAVVWIQSMIRDSDNRQLLYEAYDIAERISRAMPESQDSFLAIDHYSNLLRRFAEI